MEKVTIYYYRHYDRDFHHLIHNIASYAKEKYQAEIIHTQYDGKVDIDGTTIVVADCEILLHFKDRDSFKCISFCDIQSQLIGFFIQRNNPNDLIVYSQYTGCRFWSVDFLFKWKKSIYVPSCHDVDYAQYYDVRKSLGEYTDKFYFRGNVIGAGRSSVIRLKDSEWFSTGHTISHIDYLNDAIQHKVGLSIPGLGELCYRDIEYMAIGLPIMKLEYVTQLNPALIPNYHYIAIDREVKDYGHDDKTNLYFSIIDERIGSDNHAKKYVDRFLEVKDDYEFLEFIAKNAKEYYDTYLRGENRFKHVLNLLEI